MVGDKFSKMVCMTILALMTLVITACNQWSQSGFNNSDRIETDSTMIAQQIEAIVNPQFTSTQEVIQYRLQTAEGYVIDSLFEAIPENILLNVTEVLVKKVGIMNKKSIVEEYRANKNIYDNLPAQESTQNQTNKEVDRTGTDLGNKQNEDKDVISTRYQYRVDTLDGKPIKVRTTIKEEYVRE